jgi:hypothetical protein
MPERSHITQAMRDIVGLEHGEQFSFPIDTSDIRRWAMAVYYPEDPPRLYWDEEYAKSTIYGGIVAPEEFNPFAWMTSGGPRTIGAGRSGGVEAELGVESPPLVHLLNGGAEVEYGPARMRPGDVIRSVNAIVEYREREGRLGLMLFTISQTQWTNQHDALVKRQRSTLIRY